MTQGDDDSYTTALVTGASRGIGRAIALNLAASGYRVLLLGRDAAALAAVAKQCPGGKAEILAGDLCDPAFIEAAVEHADDAIGPIDVLVNNAGATASAPVQLADLDEWRRVLDLNFTAAVHLSRRIAPGMIERGRGAIINISSINGRHTNAGAAIYAASKHAINGFSGCLFEDVRDYGIKVATIMPGFVATDMTGRLGKDATRMIRPDDVAAAVAYVLSASRNCCPTEIVIRPQRQP